MRIIDAGAPLSFDTGDLTLQLTSPVASSVRQSWWKRIGAYVIRFWKYRFGAEDRGRYDSRTGFHNFGQLS